jgi:hypothetical protein
MTKLIIKYSILLIVSITIASLVPYIILYINSYFLTIQVSEGVTTTYGTGLLEAAITYFLNSIIIIFLSIDMKKWNSKSIFILILTFFSSALGIAFFFLMISNNHLKSKHIESYE